MEWIVVTGGALLCVLAGAKVVTWVMLRPESEELKASILPPEVVSQKVEIEDRFGPLRKDELLTAFAVADDEPLLEGVVHVLHAMEIERGDNAAESGIPAEVSKGYAMAQGALKDAQEELLRWVDEANKTKGG